MSTQRRTLQRRVYVDDDLPAFLKNNPATVASAMPAPQALPSSAILSDHPRQSMVALPTIIHSRSRYDTRFVMRLAALTIAVNAMLFALLSGQHHFASQRMSLQSAHHDGTSAPLALEDRVLTYSATSALSVKPANQPAR